jgi:hypothetical protein
MATSSYILESNSKIWTETNDESAKINEMLEIYT